MDEISLPHRHGEGRDTLPLARQLSRIEHFQTVADLFTAVVTFPLSAQDA